MLPHIVSWRARIHGPRGPTLRGRRSSGMAGPLAYSRSARSATRTAPASHRRLSLLSWTIRDYRSSNFGSKTPHGARVQRTAARLRICTRAKYLGPVDRYQRLADVCSYDGLGGRQPLRGSGPGACRSSAMTVNGTTFDRKATSFVRRTRGMIAGSPGGHRRRADCYSLDWRTATPIVNRVIKRLYRPQSGPNRHLVSNDPPSLPAEASVKFRLSVAMIEHHMKQALNGGSSTSPSPGIRRANVERRYDV
jgi:hypothetical protein